MEPTGKERNAEPAAQADRIDPLIAAAAAEVDRSLIRWMLSLSPRARLQASSRATAALCRMGRGPS